MLNLKQELQNYPPINLVGLEQKDPPVPDDIMNSIHLYNKALESIRGDSEDIAIIELKKAIALNPDFYEAMNLLGLCYIFINEQDKADALFKKVMQAEKNSIMAMEYTKMLNGDQNVNSASLKVKKKKENYSMGSKNIRKGSQGVRKRFPGKENLIKNIISFAAGAIIVLLLSLVFTQGSSAGVADNSSEGIIEELNEEIRTLKADYNKLNGNYQSLQEDFVKASENIDYYKFTIKLYEIEDMYDKREYENAADMLLLMKTVEFEEEEKLKFDKIYKKVMPAAANLLYEEGLILVNTKRQYEDAVKKLNKVGMYVENFDKMDSVLYHLGKSYQELNDSRNAVAMYQKLIENYPKSRYIKWANIRVTELTKIP